VNNLNQFDNSALMIASELGYEKVVNILLSYGAKTAQVNKLGNTALSLARNQGHEKIRSILSGYEKGETSLLKRLIN